MTGKQYLKLQKAKKRNKKSKLRFKSVKVQYAVYSHGEVQVVKTLKKLGIRYKREVEVTGMKSKKGFPLRLDFYIPRYNLAIEYDGEQHYNAKLHESREDYRYLRDCDRRKTRFCKKNKIKLLRLTKQDLPRLEKRILKCLTRK